MRAYKWVLTMWSIIAGIIVSSNPTPVIAYFAKNPQMLGTLVSMPVMIWLVLWMRKLMGHNGKDPKKWWKGDDEWKN